MASTHASGRIPFGVPALDRKLGGGLPWGSVAALTASSASQAELLLSRLMTDRQTAYLATERSPAAIRTAMRDSEVDLEDLTIYDVGSETPVLDAVQYVRERIDQELLIVDPVNRLEAADRDQYRSFLSTVDRKMKSADATALLYGLADETAPDGRTMTTYMADVVLELETIVEDESLYNRLTVPKCRGGRAFEESVRLQLTESVRVDTSRDIA